MMEKDPQRRLRTADEVVVRLAPWAADSVPTEEGGSQSGSLPSVAPSLSDTQPGLFDDLSLLHDPSSSQVSQRTDPVASAQHETLPDMERPATLIPDEPEYSWTLALAVLVPLLLAAGLLVASIALKAAL